MKFISMNPTEQDIELQQFTIGRRTIGSDNDINLDEANISRKHARVTVCGPSIYLLEDLDSKHGTFVNDERIRRKLVTDEDKITLATNHFLFKDLLKISLNKEKEAKREGKQALDYTEEFAEMQKLYENYLLFKSEEFNIQDEIKKANEKLRLGGALAAPTLVALTAATGGLAGFAAVIASVSACGLGMLIPAIGSRFLNEEEKLVQPKLYFANNWKCPNCGDKISWLNKSWEQMAKLKKCSKCEAVWVK